MKYADYEDGASSDDDHNQIERLDCSDGQQTFTKFFFNDRRQGTEANDEDCNSSLSSLFN